MHANFYIAMKNSTLSAGQPFDALARTYDSDFTDTEIGKLLRGRTHEQMAGLFPAGSELLEINCGTGEDAVFLAKLGAHVIATDESAEMISCARDKISRAGLSDKVELKHCRFEELDSVLDKERVFDGIVSNFGGINCSEDIVTLSVTLTQRVRSGGHIFLCIMGRWTPWEWFYLGWQGKFRRIWQRIKGITVWRGGTIRYYSPGRIIQCFAAYCDVSTVSGMGFLLPPTYAGTFVSRNPSLFRWLNSLEKKFESIIGIPHISDHFVLILTKR